MVRIGTCGYSYADWKGKFYPAKIKPIDMLTYYAQHFNIVEIDATYYRVLPKSTFESMNSRSPAEFRFAVKLPGTATHASAESRGTVHPDVALFYENLEPLIEHQKLACILMQFPNSFKPTPENDSYLEKLRNALKGLVTVAEFRNRDWQTPKTLELLRALDIGICNVDGPQFKSLPRASSEVAGEFAYIRFHGRNYKTWWNGTATSRYDYLYSAEELEPWVERIETVSAAAKETVVLFNNHASANATVNAKQMQELLSAPAS
ncbi:MAG: DUF72 domain-containing protein [Candidatus Eremiobacteraeota bacterium]|nr:DUF72 domain-containing protein [Candidatus Eremiobacteraeota bacterium]